MELLEEYRYLGSRNPIPAGDMNTMRRYGFGSLAAVPGQPTAREWGVGYGITRSGGTGPVSAAQEAREDLLAVKSAVMVAAKNALR